MLAAVMAVLPAVAVGTPASTPKREARGVWLATVWGLDWPSRSGSSAVAVEAQQRELALMLDRCQAMGLNSVCLQVRGMADALYRSQLEPWSAALTGRRGADPGWDPLEWAVAECHARGLECWAWVNPFRHSTGRVKDSTPFDDEWASQGWMLTWGKYTMFNPGLPEARAHIVRVCADIVARYDVDALVMDDYFYPQRISEDEATAPDAQLHRTAGPWMTLGDWRRACVHMTVADIAAAVRDIKPWVRLGVSPAGVAGKAHTSAPRWGVEPLEGVRADDWQWGEIYSDPLGLMYQGTVDFISPQIYWPTDHATAPYAPLVQWWSQASVTLGTHLYASVTLERMAARGSLPLQAHRAQLAGQIALNRRHCTEGEGGTLIYSARFLPRVSSMLHRGEYARPALMPELRRLGVECAGAAAPAGLGQRGRAVVWDASPGERRYSVYLLPPGIDPADAFDPGGDGIDGRWLHGVVYGTGFELPQWCAGERGWTVGVCVLTGASTEGAAAWLKLK